MLYKMNKLDYLKKLETCLEGNSDTDEIINMLRQALPNRIKISKRFFYSDIDKINLYFEIITENGKHHILNIFQHDNKKYDWETTENETLSTMSVDYRWGIFKIETN